MQILLQLFEKVSQSSIIDKVKAIEVDYNDEDLNLSQTQKGQLLEEVQLVFNVLASVKFNESIKSALITNVEYTRKVFELCSKMVNLKVNMYIISELCHKNKEIYLCPSPVIKYY